MRVSSGCVGGDVSITGCRLDSTLSNELVDMSTAIICQLGNGTCDGTTTTQVTSVPAMPSGGTYPSLIALVQSKSGWFTKLAVPAGGLPSERAVAGPTLASGIVFFPTFTPSGDVCVAQGSSNLYALYYVTGGAYSSPVIGVTGQNINAKVSLGEGLATEASVHEASGVVFIQASTGVITPTQSILPPGAGGRYNSWMNQRD
jgi:type IV pilus assembly protein PilY1